MADIFISYSSKDRVKAEQLTELLSSAGLSVWIDRQGIDVATSWSGEITKAISDCKALVLLLSPTSIESDNVRKEVSLAAERKKKILPLDLEPVTLPDDLAYHLTGLQRTSMSNIDSIIRALGKIGLEATQAPTIKLVKETDGRKSLMILPFEDLSPTGDNGWFADGIVSELISALSHIKSLRLMDQQETKSFKNFKGHLTTYAREMQVQYFVQGSVRKFGDQIKITTQLLDIDTGDHLWQDSHKGVMDDIFEIQERVASKVVEGLKLHLTIDEKQKLAERGTENSEAYETWLKAQEYYDRYTKQGFELAAQLLGEAISFDPKYARAYMSRAYALTELYRKYDRNADLLREAESLALEAFRLKPDLYRVYEALSLIYIYQNRIDESEKAVNEYVRKAPNDVHSHFALAFFYTNSNQVLKSIAPYEESIRLKPDNMPALINICIAFAKTNNPEECRVWAQRALPVYERYLRLHPDDEHKRVSFCAFLLWSGKSAEALNEVKRVYGIAEDGSTIYNISCLFSMLGEKKDALTAFRKALKAGYKEILVLKDFLINDESGIFSLQGTPEYDEVSQMVEEIERKSS